MATSEPADEGDLLTFSLGLEFFTSKKKKKKGKKREKRTNRIRVIVSRKTINFQTPISLFSEEKHTFSKR